MAHGQFAEAWSIFWQEQVEGPGCLANAPELLRRLNDHWREFAGGLRPGDQVLDVGCGAGAVGRALVSASQGIRVTGIDFARIRPAADARIDLLPSTRMESMPFADGSFDAGVSQFGFEYGEVDQASRELARVLKAGAPISLVVHHSEARVATDSRPHRRALESICGPQLEAAFLSGRSEELDRELFAIRRECPNETLIEFAASGLVRHVDLERSQRVQIWNAVQAALAPELLMLEALEASWVSPEQLTAWLAPLVEHFELRSPAVLRTSGGEPISWKIEGKRRPLRRA